MTEYSRGEQQSSPRRTQNSGGALPAPTCGGVSFPFHVPCWPVTSSFSLFVPEVSRLASQGGGHEQGRNSPQQGVSSCVGLASPGPQGGRRSFSRGWGGTQPSLRPLPTLTHPSPEPPALWHVHGSWDKVSPNHQVQPGGRAGGRTLMNGAFPEFGADVWRVWAFLLPLCFV